MADLDAVRATRQAIIKVWEDFHKDTRGMSYDKRPHDWSVRCDKAYKEEKELEANAPRFRLEEAVAGSAKEVCDHILQKLDWPVGEVVDRWEDEGDAGFVLIDNSDQRWAVSVGMVVREGQ